MYKLNNILFTDYGIIPSKIQGEGIAMKGIFDLPKRIGDTHYSWQDENSVQPFVDADEIFLDARELEFAGLIIGTKTQAENYVKQLQTAIDAFADLVPLETPYGNFAVLVKSISTVVKIGVTTVKIVFTEPVVGQTVGTSVAPTLFLSALYSDTAIKNDCADGFSGSEVTLTATVGKFTSTLSQQAANQLAIDWVLDQKQIYANNNGSCTVNPTVYYNTKQEGSLQRNNCQVVITPSGGFAGEGTFVTYTVEAFEFSSLISQADADAKAVAKLNSVLTQEFANENGSCIIAPNFIFTGVSRRRTGPSAPIDQFLQIIGVITAGDVFCVESYGVKVSYTVQEQDTASDIIQDLIKQINGFVPFAPINWNEFNQVPSVDLASDYYPPVARASVSVQNSIVIRQPFYNRFNSWVE